MAECLCIFTNDSLTEIQIDQKSQAQFDQKSIYSFSPTEFLLQIWTNYIGTSGRMTHFPHLLSTQYFNILILT